MAARARTVGVFNHGLPLRVVRLADETLGIVDEDKQLVTAFYLVHGSQYMEVSTWTEGVCVCVVASDV